MSRRQLTYALGLVALAVVVNLFNGWWRSPDRSSAGKPAEVVVAEKPSRTNSASSGRQAAQYMGHEPEPPTWLAKALSDPNPRVRIRALETWAQRPGETLDPVTYALVDPDESVRARAQELLEETLARR
jgi:hypothetical protein